MRLLTEKYGLPSVGTLLEETPSKEEWKKLIQDVVMQSWTTKLQEDAKSKTLLSLLDTEGCCGDQMHPVWVDIENGHLGRSKMPGLKMCDSTPHREVLFVL